MGLVLMLGLRAEPIVLPQRLSEWAQRLLETVLPLVAEPLKTDGFEQPLDPLGGSLGQNGSYLSLLFN